MRIRREIERNASDGELPLVVARARGVGNAASPVVAMNSTLALCISGSTHQPF